MLSYTDSPPSYLSVTSRLKGLNVGALGPVSVERSEKSPCLRCVVETEQSIEALTTWTQFAQRSTVHGLKVVCQTDEEDTDKLRFSVRKSVMVSIVLLNLCLLGYQVIARICTYTEYQSNVNLQFVFTDRLEFPSVTLCNQNSYRITEVVKSDMYNYIEKLADSTTLTAETSRVENARWKENLVPTVENLTQFLLTAAHQKNDFIDSCSWKGELCHPEVDFTTTFTDFGVCYTFNYRQDHRRYVNQSGARFALRLVLNIEQYEYMTALQSEIGVRVRLHAANEIPLIRDLGVSVSPGTHTLLAVHTVVADDLEPPYGNCIQKTRTRSVCMAECQAAQILQLCGCVDAFMPRINNAEVCNVSTTFSCAKKQTARLRMRPSTECKCEVPCNRTQFLGKLSYAHLSKLNVKQLSDYDRMKFKQLQQKYAFARETAEKVNKATLQRESQLVSALIDSSTSYLDTLKNNYLLLMCDSQLIDQFGVSHRATDGYSDFTSDLVWLTRDYADKVKAGQVRQPIVAKFTNVVNNIEGFLEFDDDEDDEDDEDDDKDDEDDDDDNDDGSMSVVKRLIKFCAAVEDGSNSNKSSVSNQGGYYYSCNDNSVFTYLWFKKQKLLNTITITSSATPEVDKLVVMFEAYAAYLYGNTSLDFSAGNRYFRCLKVLGSSRSLWLKRLTDLTGNLKVYTDSKTTWKKKLEIVESLESFYNTTQQNDSLLNDAWFSDCEWPGQGQGHFFDDKNYEMFDSYRLATFESFTQLNGLRLSLESTGRQTFGLVHGGLKELERILQSFQNGSLSKTELYSNLTALEFEVLFNRMRVANEKYVRDYNELISNLLFLENNIYTTYYYTFHLNQPTMNHSNILRLNVTTYARDLSLFRADLRSLLDSLEMSQESMFLSILASIYRSYRRAMEELQTRMQLSFKLLRISLVKLCDDLKESLRNSQLNDNFIMENFIKLDIFFKEMGYDKTQQQVSLDELRVISEIGSLLGLLLGASALTVCELLDFLVMHAVVRCRAKRGKWRPMQIEFANNKVE